METKWYFNHLYVFSEKRGTWIMVLCGCSPKAIACPFKKEKELVRLGDTAFSRVAIDKAIENFIEKGGAR